VSEALAQDQAQGQVIHLSDRRKPQPQTGKKKYMTVLEIPYGAIIDDTDGLIEWLYAIGGDTSKLRLGADVTAREAAILYYQARCRGILITCEAMPEVRATSLTWLGKWQNLFRGRFPIEAFLPFLAKGRS